jgi:hypothetical protein
MLRVASSVPTLYCLHHYGVHTSPYISLMGIHPNTLVDAALMGRHVLCANISARLYCVCFVQLASLPARYAATYTHPFATCPTYLPAYKTPFQGPMRARAPMFSGPHPSHRLCIPLYVSCCNLSFGPRTFCMSIITYYVVLLWPPAHPHCWSPYYHTTLSRVVF